MKVISTTVLNVGYKNLKVYNEGHVYASGCSHGNGCCGAFWLHGACVHKAECHSSCDSDFNHWHQPPVHHSHNNRKFQLLLSLPFVIHKVVDTELRNALLLYVVSA